MQSGYRSWIGHFCLGDIIWCITWPLLAAGFYGRPWTMEQRTELFKRYVAFKWADSCEGGQARNAIKNGVLCWLLPDTGVYHIDSSFCGQGLFILCDVYCDQMSPDAHFHRHFLKTLWKQTWSTALTVICHHTTPDVILDVTDHCCCLTENRSGVWTRTCTRPRMTTNTGCTGGTCTLLRRQVSLERSMSSSMFGGNLICLNWMETNNQNAQDCQTALNGILHVFPCQRSHNGNNFFLSD